MAYIWADRVLETSTVTGTGAATLLGAVDKYRTFAAVCSVSDTLPYVIIHLSANEWEVGLGTYSGVNTLTRTTVQASSNGGAAVNFSAGTKRVGLSTNALATVATQNNLSDLASAATARTNLGLVAGGAGDVWVEKAGDTMTGPLNIRRDALALTLSSVASTLEAGSALDNFCFVPFLCVSNTAGHTSLFSGSRVRYSGAATVALSANDIIMRFTGTGSFDGSNVLSGTRSEMRFTATEAWSSTANGTDIRFYTTANATTTLSEAGRFAPSGEFQMGGANTVIDSNRLHRFRAYTVATLPAAGTAGRKAYVTDALAPTYLATLVGGGAVVTEAFDNGTNWVGT